MQGGLGEDVLMNVGMLWFDNDPKIELAEKVQKAAAYYRRKYGSFPNVCFVHPSMMPGEKLSSGKIVIKADQTILPNHFWLGVNGASS